MRLLDLSEYWLVAGGDGSDEIPTVVITAPAPSPPPPYYPPSPPPYFPPPPPPPPYSGGGGSTPPPPPPCYSSPVPTNKPANVNMTELRNDSNDLSARIAAMDKSVEHGAYIYADSTGHLRMGDIYTGSPQKPQGDPDHVTIDIVKYPSERIVGMVHSHPTLRNPDGSYVEERLRSDGDISGAQWLVQNGYADANMTSDILDIHSGQLFEYTADNTSKTTLGNNLSGTKPAGCV